MAAAVLPCGVPIISSSAASSELLCPLTPNRPPAAAPKARPLPSSCWWCCCRQRCRSAAAAASFCCRHCSCPCGSSRRTVTSAALPLCRTSLPPGCRTSRSTTGLVLLLPGPLLLSGDTCGASAPVLTGTAASAGVLNAGLTTKLTVSSSSLHPAHLVVSEHAPNKKEHAPKKWHRHAPKNHHAPAAPQQKCLLAFEKSQPIMTCCCLQRLTGATGTRAPCCCACMHVCAAPAPSLTLGAEMPAAAAQHGTAHTAKAGRRHLSPAQRCLAPALVPAPDAR